MMKKVLATLLALTMSVGMLTGCGNASTGTTETTTDTAATTDQTTDSTQTETATIDTSKEVNLVMYLYGSEGVANQDILDALNAKLKESINATLEIKYIDWGDITTKYPLLWASGEDFDMAYVASGAAVPYATLAKQDALVDITDMLDTYAPTLKAALTDTAWKSMNVDGKIYGVPSTYSEYTAYGFVTRSDLLEKSGLTSVSSVADMETYMDAALKEGYTPLNGSSNLAMDLYKMLVATTGEWIDAPGVPSSEMYLVSNTSSSDTVFHPAFTDEFEAFAVKMNEWANKGYWSSDVLSATQSAKDNFYNGLSSAYITHQPDWTGSYGTQLQKLPGIDSEFYCFPEANGKIIRKMGCENATAISATSKNPERALMLIEQLMTNEECYDLFQYGILGREYEVVDNKITQPASYNAEVDGGGFAGWALRTDEFNIQSSTEDDRRYTLNAAWDKVAIDNPYVGFSFDSTNVSAELSAVANVDATLGIQIMLGKTSQDPVAAVAEYRKELKAAGIDTIIAEVNKQLADFKAQQ
jgi:putative aldouronate transport system substrate-binding protein